MDCLIGTNSVALGLKAAAVERDLSRMGIKETFGTATSCSYAGKACEKGSNDSAKLVSGEEAKFPELDEQAEASVESDKLRIWPMEALISREGIDAD